VKLFLMHGGGRSNVSFVALLRQRVREAYSGTKGTPTLSDVLSQAVDDLIETAVAEDSLVLASSSSVYFAKVLLASTEMKLYFSANRK
jgi:hypothetical protein